MKATLRAGDYATIADSMTVLGCFSCRDGDSTQCARCAGSGKVYWSIGVAFPYSARGKDQAIRHTWQNTGKNVAEPVLDKSGSTPLRGRFSR